MRYSYVVAILLFACESPIEELPPPARADASENLTPEVEVVPEVEEQVAAEPPPSVDARNVISRLNRHVTGSPRFIGDRRATDVQRVPTYHSHRFPRWMRESRIIQTDPSIDNPERLIALTALVLGRLGTSEANWKAIPWNDGERSDATGDLPRLFQVLRTQRRPGETLMNTMRNFSRIVSEMWEPSRRRERWITELNLEGDYPPSFTEDERTWRMLYREKWLEALQLARDLIMGRVNGRPCAGPLRAWGGRCDVEGGACDDHLGRARGLVPIESCGGENRYWAHPQRISLATVMMEIAWARQRDRAPDPLLLTRAEQSL